MFGLSEIVLMNAEAARERSEEGRRKDTVEKVEPLLKIVATAISRACRDGLNTISDPFDGLRLAISSEQIVAVSDKLIDEGYTVMFFDGKGDQPAAIKAIAWHRRDASETP